MTTPTTPPATVPSVLPALSALRSEDQHYRLILSADQRELLKRTVATDLTDDEFAVFLLCAEQSCLDPFQHQIHGLKRRRRVKDPQSNGWKWESYLCIQTGIDGYRLIAHRTGQYAGQDAPAWCGPDGKWKRVWLSEEPPAAARVAVYRRDCAKPFVAVALFREYVVTDPADGTPNHIWRRRAAGQLAKCAEALAIRMAFPREIGRLRTDDEMAAADSGDTDSRAFPPLPTTVSAPLAASEPPLPSPGPPPDLETARRAGGHAISEVAKWLADTFHVGHSRELSIVDAVAVERRLRLPTALGSLPGDADPALLRRPA